MNGSFKHHRKSRALLWKINSFELLNPVCFFAVQTLLEVLEAPDKEDERRAGERAEKCRRAPPEQERRNNGEGKEKELGQPD